MNYNSILIPHCRRFNILCINHHCLLHTHHSVFLAVCQAIEKDSRPVIRKRIGILGIRVLARHNPLGARSFIDNAVRCIDRRRHPLIARPIANPSIARGAVVVVGDPSLTRDKVARINNKVAKNMDIHRVFGLATEQDRRVRRALLDLAVDYHQF